ncbi:hypothetical protein BDR05DRAFT_971106 [Suillus weaverae]|nr:hypothetical protein BDR05DRAFT_971106 [Suillus weaverae]
MLGNGEVIGGLEISWDLAWARAAVAEIRNFKGFSWFLLPPSHADLRTAACQYSVIILIANQHSRSAIVVPTSEEPHHVPFPPITLTDLKNLRVYLHQVELYVSGQAWLGKKCQCQIFQFSTEC